MLIWVFLIIFIIAVYFLTHGVNTDKKRRTFLWVVGVAVALLMALRGDHGGRVYDYRVYVASFELIARTPWSGVFDVTKFEPGFVILCKLLSYISKSGQTIVIFQSFFCVFAVCRFIYKNTDQVFAAFFFFITLGTFGFMLSAIRQSIAIALVLLAVEPIKQKKLLPYALICAAAFFVHQSSLAFIPVYFLVNSKLLRKNKALYLLVILLMLVLAPQLIRYGARIYDTEWTNVEAAFSLNGIVSMTIYGAAALVQFLYNKRDNNVVLCMTSVGFTFYLFRLFGGALERVALYYTPASVLSLSDMYSDFDDQREGVLFRCIILALCVFLFIHRMQGADYGNYVLFFR